MGVVQDCAADRQRAPDGAVRKPLVAHSRNEPTHGDGGDLGKHRTGEDVTPSAQRIARLFAAPPRAGVLQVVADQHGLEGRGAGAAVVRLAMADDPLRELQLRVLNIRCAKRCAFCLS